RFRSLSRPTLEFLGVFEEFAEQVAVAAEFFGETALQNPRGGLPGVRRRFRDDLEEFLDRLRLGSFYSHRKRRIWLDAPVALGDPGAEEIPQGHRGSD